MFPALKQTHLDQIQQGIDSVNATLDDFLTKLKGKARDEIDALNVLHDALVQRGEVAIVHNGLHQVGKLAQPGANLCNAHKPVQP